MIVNSATGNGRSYPELPAAGSRRWQPIRGGLLNVYRYDYEEFRYEHGTQAELEQARKAREDMRVREAVAREKVETERRTLDAAGASRDEAIVALRPFTEAKLLDVAQAGVDAGEPASWSVSPP